MVKIYEKKIEYGMCDTNALLKIPEIFKIVEAGVASFLGLYQKDNVTMKKQYDALWLFTKTKVEITQLPAWNDIVSIEACCVKNDSKIACIIEVFIHSNHSNQGIKAWVECCVASIASRKLLRLQAIDFAIPAESKIDISYNKWKEDLEEDRSIIVTSGYIDYSRHVNNAEYIRILFDGFTIEQIENMHPKHIEVHYLSESKEQDILTIFKKKIGHTTYFQICRDQPILEMKMEE